jgi:hypothetical protein
MSTTLEKILRKVEAVQLGLLRFENKNQKLLMQARAGKNEDLLNCIIQQDACSVSLLEKNVSLIQKDKEDYLYITCKVKEEILKNTAVIISMEILKACWFTRRSKGSVSWLQEKYMYEILEEDMNIAS